MRYIQLMQTTRFVVFQLERLVFLVQTGQFLFVLLFGQIPRWSSTVYSMTEMRRLSCKESKLTRFGRNKAFISCYVINLIIYNTASKRSTVYNQNKNWNTLLRL